MMAVGDYSSTAFCFLWFPSSSLGTSNKVAIKIIELEMRDQCFSL